MRVLFLALAFLLSVPLAAQMPALAQAPRILYLGETKDSMYEAIWSLVRADGLVETGITLSNIHTDSANFNRETRDLGLMPSSRWALAVISNDGRWRSLLQGSDLPAAEALRNVLDEAGIRSPTRVLRDFLRQHPDHLDARMELLGRLREIAETRTLQVLQLDNATPAEVGLTALRSRHAQTVSIDISPFEGKKLAPEQDIIIWGPYAQELQTLFASGDWRLVPLPRVQEQIPVEAASPTMAGFYRRQLPLIETYLEEHPSNSNLWNFYGWITSVVAQSSTRALLDRLTPPPWPRMDWPIPQALGLMIVEERAKSNWGFIADTLWQRWQSEGLLFNDALRFWFAPQYEQQGWAEVLDVRWQEEIEPLLESLIRTNRPGDAETAIQDTAKFPRYRDFQRRAAELALSLDRNDLQAKWTALQIPEKPDEPDMDDLEVQLRLRRNIPFIVFINGESLREQINASIDTVLGQPRLIDWNLGRDFLNPALSNLMCKREGWQEDETHWALFDPNSKMLSYGSGLPTEDDLYRALDMSGMEIPAVVLRRFVRERPSHIEGKDQLLRELKRVAEQKTKNALGEDAGKDTGRMLSYEEDQAIWGEYAALFRQMLPYFLEQSRPQWAWVRSPADSDLFIHSPSIINLAHNMLPRVEASLRRQPSDAFLWGAWSALSGLVEHRHFKDLLAVLFLSPVTSLRTGWELLEIPPRQSRELLLGRYKARANWQGIVDIQEWRWESAWDNWRQESARLARWFWTDDIMPLLEAYLHLEKTREANELVKIWAQSPDWGQIKQSAVDLAEKCGRASLAGQWERL